MYSILSQINLSLNLYKITSVDWNTVFIFIPITLILNLISLIIVQFYFMFLFAQNLVLQTKLICKQFWSQICVHLGHFLNFINELISLILFIIYLFLFTLYNIIEKQLHRFVITLLINDIEINFCFQYYPYINLVKMKSIVSYQKIDMSFALQRIEY